MLMIGLISRASSWLHSPFYLELLGEVFRFILHLAVNE